MKKETYDIMSNIELTKESGIITEEILNICKL